MNPTLDESVESLGTQIIGAAIEVHKELGPGLLESAYHKALSHELTLRNMDHSCEVVCPIAYKGLRIDQGYRIDIFVSEQIIVELKAIEKILPKHEAQLLTYMKFKPVRLGFLINFNETKLVDGLKRMVL